MVAGRVGGPRGCNLTQASKVSIQNVCCVCEYVCVCVYLRLGLLPHIDAR